MDGVRDVLHFLLSYVEGGEPHAYAKVPEARAAVDAELGGSASAVEPVVAESEPEAEPEAEPDASSDV